MQLVIQNDPLFMWANRKCTRSKWIRRKQQKPVSDSDPTSDYKIVKLTKAILSLVVTQAIDNNLSHEQAPGIKDLSPEPNNCA